MNLWDRFYYYDNASVKYEASIDMNGKDITGVNKITTGDLDVNGQTDIKGNKIIGVGNGPANSDAVNKSQLDAVVTYVKTQVATLTDRVIRDINPVRNSLTKLQYYYFTDQVRHDNINTVKFPALNSYPYSAVNNSEYLKITLDGHYQIIYTDFYKKSGQFIIHDDTNGNDLFVTSLDNQSDWSPITINTVIPITVDNGFNYARIKMYIKTTNNAEFDGAGYSTFYIKYLNA